ncbi:antibiotic biosynthesis monooxygenase [Prauserella marina]|uniref:Monooxygenase n=1 Tax=Prauserella marina TaxID=530584 RepID=A0A222VMD3_9PSEU|nr:antibiotic biosynthesis monooxygenase family protein [Prauserella marina]ASR34881.1 antibiotic biosynthesis monooxygenase [Prauserella marina]PWV85418.1 monooxygenase [Prauserella marina]SDC55294.1 monooxygenase [Prauserella marina]
MTADGLESAITFVNKFTVHSSPEEFERVFRETGEFFGKQPGFLRYTLLKHVDEQNSYVNIAHWSDLDSFHNALSKPDFKPHASALRALSTSESNLYTAKQTLAADSR